MTRSAPAVRSAVLAGAFAGLLLAPAVAPAQDYGPDFGKNKIQYRRFTWQVYHSPHFDVHYYVEEEALLGKVVSFAESAYDRLSREFDHQIQKPTPLIFYATHSAFEQNNVILGFIPEGVGAFASPVRNRMVLPVDLPDDELFALILHELTHIFQYDIIFQGRIGEGIGSNPPQWFMEGMASYMAKDEGTSDRMFLRDAVVNDTIPSIARRGVSGFLAYRFGHSAFDYIEERWGKEGFRDLVYEYRNTFSSRIDKALERAFRIDPEDFDADFRRWLRKKYLPQLVATGEPGDFGRPFRLEEGEEGETISPAASPSGDLVAAFSTLHGTVDVVLFDAKKRRAIQDLTRGFSSKYQYFVSQYLTAGPRMGRDLAFSADGNTLAAFAKKEKGRSLVLFDVLKRKVARVVDMEVEQQHGPAFSPDGRTVAFSGNQNGRFDIFLLDLDSGSVTNLTNDELYDGAPVFSPDGKSLVYSATIGEGHAQLFRVDMADPGRRYRLTEGAWSDKDAVFSADGKRLYFTSDRSGTENIYGLNLETGEVRQYTNAVTGCFMPTVLHDPDGGEKLVYTGFWRGEFQLYTTDLQNPVGEPQKQELPAAPAAIETLPRFEPDIQVTLDDANKEKYHGRRLFLEDGGVYVGVASNQTVLGDTFLSFTDYLGNKRLVAVFSAVDTFSNFDFIYADLSRRWNWTARVFDYRDFYYFRNLQTGEIGRQQTFRMTGAQAAIVYPLDFYHRIETSLSFISRKIDYSQQVIDWDTGEILYVYAASDEKYPQLEASLVGDTAVYANWGAISGRRWQLHGSYAHSTSGGGGTLAENVDFDARQYFQVSERSNFALRLFAGWADGDQPLPYFFGGLDTVRGVDFRTLVGTRAFYANLEYRFPLLDVLKSPAFDFRGIRGRIFLDLGGAWFKGQDFEFWDGDENRLRDGVSSYGWGLTVRFLGLDLNWDFARQWDFKDALDEGFRTEFWIGTQF